MRVMHVVPYYPPERVGGVGEFAASLHAGLLARGCDSTVVTAGSDSEERVARIGGGRLGWFLGSLRFARRAAHCDIVHFHTGEALPLLLALRAWPGRRGRTLATFHVAAAGLRAAEASYRLEGERFGPSPLVRAAAGALSLLHQGVDALGLRLADSVNFISRSTARDLLGEAAASTATVIYNGVAESGEPAPAAPVELFYAGLATHRKRVLALPFVLRALRERVPDARLRIAGFEPGAAPQLCRLFERLGLREAVEWIGRRRSDELPAHYRAARVAIVPSAYEGLPYAILEAMREGTPVVATRVSGHPEVIEDGVNGFLVEVDRPREMAERCAALLCDPALAERMGAAARETVASRFAAERQVSAYLDYYRALVGDPLARTEDA